MMDDVILSSYTDDEIFNLIAKVTSDEEAETLYTVFEGKGITAFHALPRDDKQAILNLMERDLAYSREIHSRGSKDGL